MCMQPAYKKWLENIPDNGPKTTSDYPEVAEPRRRQDPGPLYVQRLRHQDSAPRWASEPSPRRFQARSAPPGAHTQLDCQRTAHSGPGAPAGVLAGETEAGSVLVGSFLPQSTPQGPQSCLPLLRPA